MRQLLRALAAALLVLLGAGAGRAAEPLPEGHAHNDYEHARPLLDALDAGFASVEADIWLVDGELKVGHSFTDLRAGRTLQSLYLGPLEARSAAGTLRPLILLIDIKSEGESTYAALEQVLAGYSGILTRFEAGRLVPGIVTAIISGNRPRTTMQSEHNRLAFYDGRAGDLGSGLLPDFMPLVSDNWTKIFSWTGAGEMPQVEATRLRELVAKAHAQGYKLRFWETPDAPGADRDRVWRALADAGVDFINTDDLTGFATFKETLARREIGVDADP